MRDTQKKKKFFFFLRHHVYYDACVFFFGGHYVVPLLLLGCVATHTLFFFLWGIFFENHGLGLGPALFRLGTRVGPAMQKNFNLSWKFFQILVCKTEIGFTF
jgi:hypothetical protein